MNCTSCMNSRPLCGLHELKSASPFSCILAICDCSIEAIIISKIINVARGIDFPEAAPICRYLDLSGVKARNYIIEGA